MKINLLQLVSASLILASIALAEVTVKMVNNKELYDLKTDPGGTRNVITEHPQVVAQLRAVYDQWWNEVQPLLVNETVVSPKINPMKELYWQQFGGSPDEKLLKQMDPTRIVGGPGGQAPGGKKPGAKKMPNEKSART